MSTEPTTAARPERTGGVGTVALVNLAAGGVGSVMGLLTAALMGRSLGADGAGAYFLVVAAAVIVANIAELGVDTGLVRFVAAARATGRDRDVVSLVRSGARPVAVVGVGVVAAGALLGLLGLHPDALPGWSVPLVALGVAAASMLAVLLSVTRGLGDALTYPALQNLALPVSRLALMSGVVALGGGATAAVLAWSLPAVVVLLMAVAVLRRRLVRLPTDKPSAAPTRELWRFSAVRGVSAGVEVLLEWVDVLLVGLLTGPTEAGIYAVVTRCVRAGEVVQQAARLVIGPTVSGAFARDDRATVRRVYGLVTAAMIWLAWPFYLLLALFPGSVLSAFGAGFGPGANALAVLALALALATAAGAVQTIVLMAGRSRWQLIDKSVALGVLVVLDVVLVPEWGITGAAVAWAVSIVVDTSLVVWQVHRGLQVEPHGAPMVWAAGLAVVGVAIPALLARLAWGDRPVVLLGTAAALAPCYLALAWAARDRLGLAALLSERRA